jgi:hypothetical protein
MIEIAKPRALTQWYFSFYFFQIFARRAKIWKK